MHLEGTSEAGNPTSSRDTARIEQLEREVENLVAAVQTRDFIGQAKGILMERYRIDADGAFQLLVKMSQATQSKVNLVAHDLVSGDLRQLDSEG